MISFATKHNDPLGKLSFTEKLCYGSGDLACNLVYESLSVYLLIYYTNVVGISTGAVASVIAISKILDGISDVVMGGLIDRTRSKLGKARPWILRFFLPLMAAVVLLFSAPAGISGTMQVLWLFVTYNLVMTVFYTAVNIPYASMISLMTSNSQERGLLSTIRSILCTVGKILVNSCVLVLVKFFNGGEVYRQKGWTWAFVVVAIFSVAFFLACVFGTRERAYQNSSNGGEIEREPKQNPIVSLRVLLTNKYWLLVLAACFLYNVSGALSLGSAAYYAQYNLGSIDVYPLLANSLQISRLTALLLVAPLLIRRLGNHRTFQVGTALTILGFALIMVAPENLGVICAANVINGIGSSFVTAMFFGLLADSIDYGAEKTGIACAGMGTAANSFGIKLGGSLGTLLWSFVLNRGGFSAALESQPAGALMAIRFTYYLIPCILTVMTILVMSFYDLDRIRRRTSQAPV